MTFSIEYDKQPLRFLKQQDNKTAARILDKIDAVLTSDPVPHSATSIVGEHGIFRIRIGAFTAVA